MDYRNVETGITISERDLQTSYLDMLNDVYGEIEIAGYKFDAGDTLFRLDPTAFRCGFLDYIDGEWDEI